MSQGPTGPADPGTTGGSVTRVLNPVSTGTGTSAGAATGAVTAASGAVTASGPTALATTGAGGDLGLLVMAGLLTLLGLSLQRFRRKSWVADPDAYTPVFTDRS